MWPQLLCPYPVLPPAGPFAVISVMIGSVTDLMVPSGDFMEPVNGTNNTILNEAKRDAVRVELVAALTILVGIFQVSRACRAEQGAAWDLAGTTPGALMGGGDTATWFDAGT